MKALERSCAVLVMEGIMCRKAISKDKDFPSHFGFFSLPDPSRIQHSEGIRDGIRFLCIKPIRPVVNRSSVNQDFNWNGMPEGGVSGLWMSPESPEELGLTFEASKSPWKKLGTLVGCVVRGDLSGEGTKVAFLNDG